MAEQASNTPPRWHRFEPAMVEGEPAGWCNKCGGQQGAEWHRRVPQAGDPPTLDSVLSKLEWCLGGEWSVPLKPAEAVLLVPILREHLGRPPA